MTKQNYCPLAEFEKALRRSNLRPKPQPFISGYSSSQSSILSKIINCFSAPLRGNRWMLAHDTAPTSIIFGVTHDEEFNAFAFLSANQHCIAFNHSVFPILLQIFCELVSQPTFLPMVGDPAATSSSFFKAASKSATI